jgi:hypothetical protein
LEGRPNWQLNSSFKASFMLACADAHDAVEQGFGWTESFKYEMAYLPYAYGEASFGE